MNLGDQKLIGNFLRGESAAVEQIKGWIEEGVRRFRPRLDQPWEDVQQELLMEVTRLLRKKYFRGDSKLRTYLWRIAKYHCLDLLRDQARHQLPRSDPGGEELERVPTHECSPLERVLKKEATDGLVRLMEAMQPECRKLWKMILADKSYHEMSQELHMAEGALRVRVLRCRRKAVELWETWRDEQHGKTHEL